MSNPELWLDPDKRSSWYVVGGVIAFFSVYLTVSAYREGLFDATASTTEPAPQVLDAEVHKVLVDLGMTAHANARSLYTSRKQKAGKQQRTIDRFKLEGVRKIF